MPPPSLLKDSGPYGRWLQDTQSEPTVMPSADTECGLALARTAPDKQDQNILIAWLWLFSSPYTRSMVR